MLQYNITFHDCSCLYRDLGRCLCTFFLLLHVSSRVSHPQNFHFFYFPRFFSFSIEQLGISSVLNNFWTCSIQLVHDQVHVLVQIRLVQVLFMNMFMNLFKFDLFKYCSKFVLKFEHVHEQFIHTTSCSWTCSQKKKLREKFEHVHDLFMNTWTRVFLQLVHEQKFGLKELKKSYFKIKKVGGSRTTFFTIIFGIFPKVELPTSRYFENSQSLEISIPNDSQKFSHFFDCVPVRGCVFAFFHFVSVLGSD